MFKVPPILRKFFTGKDAILPSAVKVGIKEYKPRPATKISKNKKLKRRKAITCGTDRMIGSQPRGFTIEQVPYRIGGEPFHMDYATNANMLRKYD